MFFKGSKMIYFASKNQPQIVAVSATGECERFISEEKKQTSEIRDGSAAKSGKTDYSRLVKTNTESSKLIAQRKASQSRDHEETLSHMRQNSP